jgi:DNA-binding SARP family transcriptional activator/tetratricopeptide (TPR) repeat protein
VAQELAVEFRILGSLEARDGGDALPLGGVRERSLLALLLLNANELVPTDRLVDELWGDPPPKTAVKTVQVYVSRFRKLLGATTIVTRPPGYLLQVDPESIDLHRFDRLAGEGRQALAADDPATAGRLLREALLLWHGAPLADFAYEPFAQAEAARLEELRVAALEDRVEADLRCGRAADLVGELQALAARHPLRERPRAQLMLALYRCGRQAEALDVFRDTRTTLVEELGIEPSQDLQRLELAVLRQDPSLERPARPSSLAAGIFVGRGAELAALVGALGKAETAQGSVFLVSGEPGIGKSRLVDEVVAHARDRGLRVLRGRCWEAGGAPAYWPWVQMLRAYVRGAELDELRARLGPRAAELGELLPELRELLGDLPRPRLRDPEALRFRLFDAIASWLREVSAERGLLAVLDDLHAADTPSLLLLQFVAGTVGDARMVVLAAYRDTELGTRHALDRVVAELVREPAVSRISLPGLRRPEIAEYVELSTGGPVPDRVVEAIHSRTEGNPLFVAETVRLLAAEGQLERIETAAVVVPAGVREAINRRVERLSLEAREALTVASVHGREFEPEVLERLETEGDVAGALDESIRARLVTAAPGAPGTLRFSHTLVRDVLYDAIPAPRRRQLHDRVATQLERRHRADPGPHLARLAQHFFEAASWQQAAEYARLAAERAAAQLAYEESARLYRLALGALERAGDADEPRFCDLLLGLGEAQARAGDDAGAQETFLRAADVARRAGLAVQLGRAALGYGGRWVWTVMRGDPHIIPLLEEAIGTLPREDSELRVRLLARLAAGPLKIQGDSSRRRRFDLSAEAVEMARRLDEPAVLAWALDGRKVAIWGPDTLEEHWAIIDELRDLAETAGDPEQLVDAHICALIKLFGRFELGRFDVEHARATKAAAQLRQPGQQWLVAVMAPVHALLMGRLADAERLIDEAFELGRHAAPWNARVSALLQRFALRGLERRLEEVERDLRSAAAENPWYPTLHAALASLYAGLGDTQACRAAFEGLAGDGFAAVPMDDEWLLTMGLLAEACAFLGDTERAADLYARLEPYPDQVLVGPIEIALGSAAWPLGKLAATLGRPDDAARWLARAARDNERAGAQPWAAHARLDHARLLLAEGERAAAEALLEQAAETYRELGMDGWAAACRAPAAVS